MPSAIATSNVFPGEAVAQSKSTVSQASRSLLATHIAISGAPIRGVVTMTDTGVVTLNDWTLATGGMFLMTGATYFVGQGGKLTTGGGQPVGIATSPKSLSVTIQNNQVAGGSTSSSTALASLQSQIDSLFAQVSSLATNFTKLYSGTFAIGNASNAGSVTGLSITNFTPTKAIATVRAPAGGLNIAATVVDATITTGGFQFTLDSLTDSANYKLDFILLP